MESVNQTQNKLHHLSQFLAAFSNSFLPKVEDDSQSNLSWSTAKNSIISRVINDFHLELDFEKLCFKFVGNNTSEKLNIIATSKVTIDAWLRANLDKHGFDSSQFNYDLGFKLETDFETFNSINDTIKNDIQQLIEHRNLCQFALEKILEEHQNPTDIRIWPHHFDTGMLIDLSTQKNMSIGLGLGYAIADSVSNLPYYYTYGWGNNEVDYTSLPNLKNGIWATKNWKGALLQANTISQDNLENFYNEAITILMSKLS